MPFPDKILVQPLSPDGLRRPLADIDLVSIEFNTPPHDVEVSGMPLNDLSSISHLVGQEPNTSILDHQIPSATRTKDSSRFEMQYVPK